MRDPPDRVEIGPAFALPGVGELGKGGVGEREKGRKGERGKGGKGELGIYLLSMFSNLLSYQVLNTQYPLPDLGNWGKCSCKTWKSDF